MKKNMITLIFFVLISGISHLNAQKRADFKLIEIPTPNLNSDKFEVNVTKSSNKIKVYSGEPDLTIPNTFYFNPYEQARLEFYSDILKTVPDASISDLLWVSSRFDITPSTPKVKILSKKIRENDHFLFLKSEKTKDGIYQAYEVDMQPYFQPFYFKEFEVTNYEYRAFINSVKDSILFQAFGNLFELDNGKEYIDYSVDIDLSDPMLKKFYEYDENTKTKTFKKEYLVYHYEDKQGQIHDIPIYPDTTVWINGWTYSYNVPMTTNYFWHPAFNDFPIVGVTYHQAKAYCHWLQKQLETSQDIKNTPYEIEVDLPRAFEWQWLAMSNNSHRFSYYLTDTDWNTDLMLTIDRGEMQVQDARNQNQRYRGNLPIDGSLYTAPANMSSKKLYKSLHKKFPDFGYSSLAIQADINGISGMSNNVSEWMSESYEENWETSFNRYIELISEKSYDNKSTELTKQIALYYNDLNDKDGQLVYGGNWFDERYSNIDNKNKAGLFAKRFVSPDKARSTLGFRYVVRVKMK